MFARNHKGRATEAVQEASPLQQDAVSVAEPRPLLARLLPDPKPWREDLATGRHAVRYVLQLMRGNRIERKEFFSRVSPSRPPVLLLHGFLGTRGSLFTLEERLASDGLCVLSFNLGLLNARDIRSSALLIQRKIDSILRRTGLSQLDIVGYSMGGLIGLHYVKKLEGHRNVRRLIMLGTPHRGTWAALPAVAASMMGLLSPSAWQLLPGSRFLRELQEGPLPAPVEYYTIAGERDWTCPASTARLYGATEITVPLGHPSLVISEEIYKRILWVLRH